MELQLRKIQRDIELTQRNMEVFSELLSELQTGEVILILIQYQHELIAPF